MKIISVRQPWASLIASGAKDVERSRLSGPLGQMGQRDVSQIKPQQTEGFNFNRGTVGTGTTGWVRWLAVTIAIVDCMMAVRAWR
jgi:hypothetical protein